MNGGTVVRGAGVFVALVVTLLAWLDSDYSATMIGLLLAILLVLADIASTLRAIAVQAILTGHTHPKRPPP
ncbi:MAG: hypothetical protein H7Y15_08230 [Pseudonocardia sp.]|nr:hypothetical protein [Pseudonocardia sp.]